MALQNRIELPLGLGYWKSRSAQNNRLTLQNMYTEADPLGTSKVVLYPTAGTRKILDFGTGNNVRALLPDFSTSNTKRFFAVTGTTLNVCTLTGKYSCIIDDTYSLDTFSGGIDNYPIELIQTDNDNLFILEPNTNKAYNFEIGAGVLTEITDADYPAEGIVHTGCTLDTYVIVSIQDSAKFFISDVADPTSWDATRLASAESNPDLVVRVLANTGYLWVFGSLTCEVWYNSANIDFPFEPMPNAYFNFGLLGPAAITNVNGTLFLVATSSSGALQFVRIDSFQSTVVSTPAIDELFYRIKQTGYQINQYKDINKNIIVNHFFSRGHTFVYITVPALLDKEGTGFTVVYDPTTQMWHTRSSKAGDNFPPSIDPPRISSLGPTIMTLYGFTYVGSVTQPFLYIVDSDTYTDSSLYVGDELTGYYTIDRIITTRYIDEKNSNVRFHTIELDVEQPVTGDDDSKVPYIQLSYSDDGGETWSTPASRTLSTVPGRYRIRWLRLGASRNRVFKFETNTPYPLYIHNCMADISTSTS